MCHYVSISFLLCDLLLFITCFYYVFLFYFTCYYGCLFLFIYFLFYCMNLKSLNPTNIPGPFAPLASSPPCTHLCPLVSPCPLAHTSLPPKPVSTKPSTTLLQSHTPSSLCPCLCDFADLSLHPYAHLTPCTWRGEVDDMSLQIVCKGSSLFKEERKHIEKGRERYGSAAQFNLHKKKAN